MDYQKEFKRLQEGGTYWKPKVGQFKVKALSELMDTEPYKKKVGEQVESHDQAKILILVGGEEKTWTFGKGVTLSSTYGQLCKLATENANQLTGVEFTVAVKSDGTKNDYTIVN
jgi:hypothetical protein